MFTSTTSWGKATSSYQMACILVAVPKVTLVPELLGLHMSHS